MLVLTRKTKESIIVSINGEVVATIAVTRVDGGEVRIGCESHQPGVVFERNEIRVTPPKYLRADEIVQNDSSSVTLRDKRGACVSDFESHDAGGTADRIRTWIREIGAAK